MKYFISAIIMSVSLFAAVPKGVSTPSAVEIFPSAEAAVCKPKNTSCKRGTDADCCSGVCKLYHPTGGVCL